VFMQGVDLGGEQVKALFEVGVACRVFGVVIEVAVVTFGKDGHAVDVGVEHGPDESVSIKLAGDGSNVRTGVEVQVNLAKGQIVGHVYILAGMVAWGHHSEGTVSMKKPRQYRGFLTVQRLRASSIAVQRVEGSMGLVS